MVAASVVQRMATMCWRAHSTRLCASPEQTCVGRPCRGNAHAQEKELTSNKHIAHFAIVIMISGVRPAPLPLPLHLHLHLHLHLPLHLLQVWIAAGSAGLAIPVVTLSWFAVARDSSTSTPPPPAAGAPSVPCAPADAQHAASSPAFSAQPAGRYQAAPWPRRRSRA